MIVKISEIIARAQKEGYAVGAFNVTNIETVIGVVRAAVAQKAPIIIQVSETTLKYAGVQTIADVVSDEAATIGSEVPIALHLDHGRSFSAVTQTIKAGFSSIMIDASGLPFAENVALTKQAVDYAHQNDVWAQGELGQLGGKEDAVVGELACENYTDPVKAQEFVKLTGVDTLAVAVGNIHGVIKMKQIKAELDLNRLAEIHKKVPIPLVLHGASGLGIDQINGAIKAGVRIINIDTEIRQAFALALRETLNNNPEEIDPRKFFLPSIEAVKKIVEQKIAMFGSIGKAK